MTDKEKLKQILSDAYDANADPSEKILAWHKEEVAKVVGAIRGTIKVRKPSHGQCCQCRICGYDYDDCECYENGQRVKKFLDKLEQSQEDTHA